MSQTPSQAIILSLNWRKFHIECKSNASDRRLIFIWISNDVNWKEKLEKNKLNTIDVICGFNFKYFWKRTFLLFERLFSTKEWKKFFNSVISAWRCQRLICLAWSEHYDKINKYYIAIAYFSTPNNLILVFISLNIWKMCCELTKFNNNARGRKNNCKWFFCIFSNSKSIEIFWIDNFQKLHQNSKATNLVFWCEENDSRFEYSAIKWLSPLSELDLGNVNLLLRL